MSLIDSIDSADKSLFLKMNGWHAEWLDPIMWNISEPLTWIPVYGLIFFLGYKKMQWPGVIQLLLGIGIVVLLADNIHRECFKEVFERLRPSKNEELKGLVHHVINPKNGTLYTGGKYGFISGHASNFIGIATFVILFLGLKSWWKWAFITWALLICYSRIYLGVHYPGDILGGICLGVSVGFLTSFLVKKFLSDRFQK